MKLTWVAGLLLWMIVLPLSGQSDAAVRIDYSNPALIPGQWSMEIHPDGRAHFESKRGTAARDPELPIEPPNLDRDVQLDPTFAARVFRTAKRKHFFKMNCESHLKVAFQGNKTLTYTGPEGTGSCEFNYSRDPDIQSLSDSLQSVATTIIEGGRLESLLQHDRLGLDRDMQLLTQMAADGRAQQMEAISGILRRLADDDSVLERVRRRARALLGTAND